MRRVRVRTTQLRSGFTLVEVLLAIAVAGILFTSLAALQLSNIRVTTSADRDTRLLERAVDIFEGVKIEVESDFGTYNACPEPPDPPPGFECVFDQGGATVTVDGAPESLNGLVLVTIHLSDERGREIEFRQFLSCLDSVETPTIKDADGECSL